MGNLAVWLFHLGPLSPVCCPLTFFRASPVCVARHVPSQARKSGSFPAGRAAIAELLAAKCHLTVSSHDLARCCRFPSKVRRIGIDQNSFQVGAMLQAETGRESIDNRSKPKSNLTLTWCEFSPVGLAHCVR